MKIYLSADIEGVAGICHWDEANPAHPAYREFQERMTASVAAACEGAIRAGATEILVKDAHASGRNILADRLPRPAKMDRGWSGHPLMMVEGLDQSYDAVLFVGYHSRAGSGGNPLAHTLSSSKIAEIRVNDEPLSEFHLYGRAAGRLRVPVALVSGDRALCSTVTAINEAIHTVPVMEGIGAATVSLHPAEAEERIREGVERALSRDLSVCLLAPPEHCRLEVRFKEAARAYRASFFPGMRLAEDHVVALETDDWFEVLRALHFTVY